MIDSLKRLRSLVGIPKSPLDVASKVALVTGGADGIGFETARCLRERGAFVAIVDRDAAMAAKAAERLGPSYALPIVADVTDRVRMKRAVEEVIARFGRLDVVVANAGISPVASPLRTASLDDFDRVMNVNVTGVLNTVHPAIEELIRRKGHIVVVASAAAFSPPMCAAAYMISKAAVEQLGRAFKLELAQHGVTATVSYFGVVDTGLTRRSFDEDDVGGEIGRQLPGPLQKRVTARAAGEVIANAIEARAEYSMLPSLWQVYSVLRGVMNPVLDRVVADDPEVRDIVLKLERRNRDRPR